MRNVSTWRKATTSQWQAYTISVIKMYAIRALLCDCNAGELSFLCLAVPLQGRWSHTRLRRNSSFSGT